MKIQSIRFGELDVPENNLLDFPHGLPGFRDVKQFAFLPHEPNSAFSFLQAVGDPYLTFVIAEPFGFFPDYKFEIDDATASAMGLSNDNPPQVFVIATLPKQLENMTVNLLAPVLINWKDHQAMQLVLERSSYTTKHRLFPNGFPKTAAKGGE